MNEDKLRRLTRLLVLPLVIGGIAAFAYYRFKYISLSSIGSGASEYFAKFRKNCPEVVSKECRDQFHKFERMNGAKMDAEEASEIAATALFWAIIPPLGIILFISAAGYVSNGRLPNLWARKKEQVSSVD